MTKWALVLIPLALGCAAQSENVSKAPSASGGRDFVWFRSGSTEQQLAQAQTECKFKAAQLSPDSPTARPHVRAAAQERQEELTKECLQAQGWRLVPREEALRGSAGRGASGK